jgi:hypothetical protein
MSIFLSPILLRYQLQLPYQKTYCPEIQLDLIVSAIQPPLMLDATAQNYLINLQMIK